MNLLTIEQIKELRGMQLTLDERIRKEHEISEEVDLSLEKYLALKTEFFEFVNEVESFKYWKKNKGKDKILEEACDTLHFILSLMNDGDIETEHIDLGEFTLEDYDMNTLFGILDATISDAYAEREWSILNATLMLLCIAVGKCGFTGEDLYNAYISKNKENHKRQDNKY